MKLAAGFCLLLLIAGEISLRVLENSVSANAAQISSQLQELDASTLDTVVIGNSLSKHAFEGRTDLQLVTPDSSGLYEWYFITKHHEAAFRQFDRVIIAYAWNQLSDQHTVLLDTIGGHLGTARDVSDIGRRKHLSFDARVDYLLSNFSKLWLYKTRIRRKIETLLLHDYEQVTQTLNAAANAQNEGYQAARKRSYTTMADILERLAHAQITVVAMPLKADYPIDADLVERIDTLDNVNFLDLRNFFRDRNLSVDDFYVDHIHVNQAGADLLSDEILAQVKGR
jgi:hypothetical protein